MSISSEITRIRNIKANIISALQAKGSSISTSAKLADVPTAITNLPSGLSGTILRCLETSGGKQYIKLSVQRNDVITFGFATTQSQSSEGGFAGYGTSSTGYWELYYEGNTLYNWTSGTNWGTLNSPSTGTTVSANQVVDFKVTINQSFDFQIGIYRPNQYTCPGKIYGIKQTRSGSVIHDLIPMLINNTPVMYDLITGSTYSNAGTGTFGYVTTDGVRTAPR